MLSDPQIMEELKKNIEKIVQGCGKRFGFRVIEEPASTTGEMIRVNRECVGRGPRIIADIMTCEKGEGRKIGGITGTLDYSRRDKHAGRIIQEYLHGFIHKYHIPSGNLLIENPPELY